MIGAKGLCFRYPGRKTNALDGMDLDIATGEKVLLSGPTGCGKSTLGLALCGAVPNLINGCLKGELYVNGLPCAGRTIREIAEDLGFLMQNVEYQAFTDNVAEEIAFGLENFGVKETEMEARIRTALRLGDVEHLMDRRLATLSAGEKQRVMLASMLALDQKAVVLDEPLAYLDREAQGKFLSTLSGLVERGKTVLIFEHRRDVVRGYQSNLREIYMQAGRQTEAPSLKKSFRRVGSYSPEEPELVFENVFFGWTKNASPLFSDLSLEVGRHQSVVVLGRNGSGKTTLMKLAMGLLKPGGGKIRICGRDAASHSPSKISESASFIFQYPDHQLYLPYVREEVRARAANPETSCAELSALGLEGLEDRHPRSLSMGQKRRLTLAAALAARPKLLLLDEPSVGQDDASLSLMIRRLDRYLEEGGALLTATHDDRAARALAHRIVIVENGGIREHTHSNNRKSASEMP